MEVAEESTSSAICGQPGAQPSTQEVNNYVEIPSAIDDPDNNVENANSSVLSLGENGDKDTGVKSDLFPVYKPVEKSRCGRAVKPNKKYTDAEFIFSMMSKDDKNQANENSNGNIDDAENRSGNTDDSQILEGSTNEIQNIEVVTDDGTLVSIKIEGPQQLIDNEEAVERFLESARIVSEEQKKVIENFQCKFCIYCKDSVGVTRRMKKHVTDCHDRYVKRVCGRAYFRCLYCNRYMVTPQKCREHMIKEHFEEYQEIPEPTIPCCDEKCIAVLRTQEDLEEHVSNDDHIYPHPLSYEHKKKKASEKRVPIFSSITSKFHM